MSYAALTYARGTLVDVGCGEKPWVEVFSSHVEEHIGVDHEASPHGLNRVDVIAGAYEIPLADESADTVLLSAVLEHLERPADAIAEAHRLLRPGGHLILTAPFFWPLHEEPRDFYRYSPYGLRYLLEQAGFEVVEVVPLSGAWTTFALELSYALTKYRRGPLRPFVDLVTRLVQWTAPRWDRFDFQPRFSWNHLAVGRRR